MNFKKPCYGVLSKSSQLMNLFRKNTDLAQVKNEVLTYSPELSYMFVKSFMNRSQWICRICMTICQSDL